MTHNSIKALLASVIIVAVLGILIRMDAHTLVPPYMVNAEQ